MLQQLDTTVSILWKIHPSLSPTSTCYLIVCFYHVTYEFESESTLYNCLNVKELLARSSRHIWRLSDCNGTRTHNHLVRKRTLNHLAKLASLAKWLSVRLRTKWLWVRVPLQSLNPLVILLNVFEIISTVFWYKLTALSEVNNLVERRLTFT